MSTAAFWSSLWPALAPFEVVLTVVTTIIAAIVLRFIFVFISRAAVRRVVRGAREKAGSDDARAIALAHQSNPRVVQRTKTMGSVLDNFVTWTIALLALIIVMQELGIPVAAVLASAGIIGAALAFGAQNIIKDVLSGFLMVLEDQLGVGDEVDLGLAVGTVEAVGVRITTLRDNNGVIWFVRNGEILRVGNKSYVAKTPRERPEKSGSGNQKRSARASRQPRT